MAFNEKVFLSFIHFTGDSDRITHFFYQLLWMYPLFVTNRNSPMANQYVTGNPSSNTRCNAGSDPACITFPD